MVSTISVLYVDDESSLLEISKKKFERTPGFAMTTASCASSTFDQIKANMFQAIVSDYQMPEMDGIEFLKQIRAFDKHIPFILFTSMGREKIAIEAFENGADFYLQKGGDPNSLFAELRHKIKAAVGHRQAEAEVATINRLHTVISATNKAIIRIQDKKELLHEICRIVVDDGGITMAWAGFVNNEKQVIEPVAASGPAENYLDTVTISTYDTPLGRGPTGTALRRKTFGVCNDIKNASEMAPWRIGALRKGYRSIAAFPFAQDSGNTGVITCFAAEPGFFTDQIIWLLEQLSRDISSALQTIDLKEGRITAQKEQKKSELRYRRLFETAQDGILILDGDSGEIIDANPFILSLLGYPIEYFVGRQLGEPGFLKDKAFAQTAFMKLKTEGYIRYDDLPLQTQQGKTVSVEFVINVYLVGNKRIIQCNIRDNTDLKRAKKALSLASRKLNLMSGISRHDIMNQLMGHSGSQELSEGNVSDTEGIPISTGQ